MSNPFDTSKAARGSNLLAIKTAQKAREEEERIKARRRRGIVVMMLQFLHESGYKRTLDALEQDSQTSLARVAPADNMDIASVFAQFEEYHEFKFGRRPRFYRNVEGGGEGIEAHTDAASGEAMMERRRQPKAAPTPPPPSVAAGGAGRGGANAPNSAPSGGAPQQRGGKSSVPTSNNTNNTTSDPPNGGKKNLNVDPLPPISGTNIKTLHQQQQDAAEEAALLAFQGRSNLRALPVFETKELNDLAHTVHREILDENPSVTFEQVAELHAAKQLLKEAVVMPVKYPQLFDGLVRPWKGILLFGPPGTGKTLLAKAVATECRTTFFNISTSTLVSKWRGDSEKLVRMLFDLAVHFAPSTIFLDELDSMMSARASDGSEHEATRRMKTEFLVQMDGLSKRRNGDIVFVLAASNIPWDLDAAVLRRLEKRIYVPLPTVKAREVLLRHSLPRVDASLDFGVLARRLEGYSGADIDILCREATMRTVRLLIDRLEKEHKLDTTTVEKPTVSMDDVLASIEATRPSAQSIPLAKYVQWAKSFGSTLSEAAASSTTTATTEQD